MEHRGWSLAGERRMLLPIVLFALALQTSATAQAGEFPAFVPMPGVTPRGVAVDKVGSVYVSIGEFRAGLEYIQVRKFTPDGEQLFSVEIGQGTIGGLMVAANGDLYIALAAGSSRGVYRMDRDGHREILPGSDQIFFANGLAFDDRGTLYVTESASVVAALPHGPGGIWRIPRRGVAELWMRDELLKGTGALGQPVWFGANGIACFHGNLYVTNTEKGTVMQIPVLEDGTAGVPEVWELQEVWDSPFAGKGLPMGDGLVLDVHGNLYVAVLTRSAVVRINARDLSQETVALFMGSSPVGPPPDAALDFPASLFFGTGKGERTNLFVTNLGLGVSRIPGLPWAGPGVVKIDAGVPGDPLH